ncbi:hypothetical protein BDAP_000409 [Binucleata daphniae]
MINDFSKQSNENIYAWTIQRIGIQKIYNLRDNNIHKILAKKLQDEVLDYYIKSMSKTRKISNEFICQLLQQKYHIHVKTYAFVKNLTKEKKIKTNLELEIILKEAEYINKIVILTLMISNILFCKDFQQTTVTDNKFYQQLIHLLNLKKTLVKFLHKVRKNIIQISLLMKINL